MTILLIVLAAVCAATIAILSVKLARTKSDLHDADSVIAGLVDALERTQAQLSNALPTPKEPTYL